MNIGGRGAIWMSRITPQQLPNVVQFAVDTDRLIQERPSQIVLTRDKGDGNVVVLEPQTIRIEIVQSIRNANERVDAMVIIAAQYVVMVGYKDHPTIPNTDWQRDDTFFYQKRLYKVIELIDTVPGRSLASGELTP